MERKKMKKKGFTLVELLVVIAIIAMLLAILMPALGKVRQLAQRLMCGTNLSGIGKAMLVYTNDDEYESFPIAGGAGALWDFGTTAAEGICTWEWRDKAAIPGSVTGTKTTLSACLYMLVKYADVSPDQFICPGGEEKKFELAKYVMTAYPTSTSFADVWDFGAGEAADIVGGLAARARGHNSYSYNLPLPLATTGTTAVAYPITTTSNPAKVVMADRNPFWDKTRVTAGGGTDPDLYAWLTTPTPEHVDSSKLAQGNATAHQKDGQNVLYTDNHTKFEKSANCGIEMDNIYTTWGKATLTIPTDEKLRQCGITGTKPTPVNTVANCSLNDNDNYLVQDYN